MKIIIRWQLIALFGLTLLGLALRLYGLNWDEGNSFHPDERQILFHVQALSWPDSLAQFFDPANSPLNPHFFAYGSFPLYLLASIGNILSRFYPAINSLANLTLVGRVLSALFDSGTILLTGCLGFLLADDATPERQHAWALALFSATLVTFTPLQIQLAHFYAVDSLLLFFIVFTILACVALVKSDKPLRWSILVGLGYGLALATKFSAAPLVVPILVALLLRWRKHDLFSSVLALLIIICVTWISFLIAMPYAFLDLPNFVKQVADQGSLARGSLDLPYVRQFAGTIPYVYEIQNMILWGMGLMLGLVAFGGLLWFVWRIWRRNAGLWLIVLSWVLVYGAITGSFYVKFMRYMLPLYPFLTLMGAALLLALAVGLTPARGALRGRFFGGGDVISRRGGSGVDVGRGPLWPPAGWKGPLSTKHGGQPQGPQPRSTPPLPLRDSPRYGKTPAPESTRGVTTDGTGRNGGQPQGPQPRSTPPLPLRDSPRHGTPLVGVRPTHLDSLPNNEPHPYSRKILMAVPPVAILLVLLGTMFQGLALLNVYSQPSTRIVASLWIYNHIRPGSVFTYEQWDDALPYVVGDHVPYIYAQLTYPDASGQPQMGLDLYGDDTTAKARQLANLLPKVDVLTMATDRLDKSIPRLPLRYPLTIHYYKLLFSGQLGFHLAAQFQNHPNLFGITLDDSNADESYSVFDHPTVRIFVRDNPYLYTADQLFQKLLGGVQLPPAT